MATGRETKYRLTVEDNSGRAFASFKSNVKSVNQNVERLRTAMRLSVMAIGAGGLIAALTGAIAEGAKFDATLAGAKGRMDAASAAGSRFRNALASGIAPAVAVVSEGLAGLMAQMSSAAERGPSMWDKILGFAASAATGGKIGAGHYAELLRAKREQIKADGELIMERQALAQQDKRIVELTDSVRTAQEKYNDAVGEYTWLRDKANLSEETYLRLVEKARREILKPAPPAQAVPGLPIEAAEEFREYTDEWHEMLLGALAPNEEDIPAARSKWELYLGEIAVIAQESADDMARAFTDALFDVENAFQHLKDFATSVLRAISDALIGRYITGPIMAGIGGGGAGGGEATGGGEVYGPPAPDKSLAPVTVQVNLSAIDTQSGLAFLAGHARSLAAIIQRETDKRGRRGGPLS